MIILPGLGGDAAMFPQKFYSHIPWIDFVDWPLYQGEKTIEQVAQNVIQCYNLKKDPLIGGASLGGMVAIEIAKMLNIPKVILISSTHHPSHINPALKKLSYLAEMTPVHLIQLLAGKINRHIHKDVLAMFEKADSDFIRSMAQAVFKWPGMEDYNCDIRRIHGKLDLVIFPPKNNVQIIPWAGHMISMTHAAMVAKFIQENINS